MPNAPSSFTGPRKAQRSGHYYDRQWRNLRAAHLAEHPLCVVCKAKGIVTLALQVDHRIRFKGKDDPLRLDASNLDSLCLAHHQAKTAAERRQGHGG